MSDELEKELYTFFFENSLYQNTSSTDDAVNIIYGDYSSPKIMGYCVTCAGERPFSIHDQKKERYSGGNSTAFKTELNEKEDVYIFLKKITCNKCSTNYRFFVLKLGDNELIKLGQLPSIADISQKKKHAILTLISKYFSDIDRTEFNKALGLFAHGEGIAPLVFLRRIIERLVHKTFEDNKEAKSWKDDDLPNRMLEKIDFLKDVLPKSLYEFRSVYSIMSKGIHELSEDECKSAFPDLIAAIEFIVTDKANAEESKKQRENLRKRIHAAASVISK